MLGRLLFDCRRKTLPAALRARALLVVVLAWCFSAPAHALPSFAAQTGAECGACHVGSFGPQLTPFGQRFKLGGYTLGNKDGLPLAAMLVTNFTHVAKDQAEAPAKHFDTNDNTAIQEVSGFVAGRLSEHMGTFAQVTYSGVDRKLAWDNIDLRYARPLELSHHEVVLGATVNNNPSVQDPWNTTPAWGFPYTAADLASAAEFAPVVAGGLEMQVVGASAYALVDDHYYVELGGYRSLSKSVLDSLGVPRDDVTTTSGISPYWRLAYSDAQGASAYSFGLLGFESAFEPDPGMNAHDRYRDIGIDGSYQFLGTRRDILTINASAIREHQRLGATFGDGGADHRSVTLDSYKADVALYHAQTYGLTLGYFAARGTRDSSLYGDNRTGRPDTSGEVVQIDYTPLGKEDSPGAPLSNLRLGLQYTLFDQFDGARHDYDGSGRGASDNNSLMAFLWIAL